MEYQTCFYEALTRHMHVSWSFLINKVFSEQEVNNAIQHVHAKHPYLRCRIHEGSEFGKVSLIDKNTIVPVMFYSEGFVNDSIIHQQLEEFVDYFCNTASIDDTVHYKVISDKENNKTGIMACFCHSCADALSSLRVAKDILHYLDHPEEPLPTSREFVSVQTELIVQPEEPGHVRFANQQETVWIAPIRFRNCEKGVDPTFHTNRVLIEPKLMDTIIEQCHKHECSFQAYLWSVMAICFLHLFKKDLPTAIRFGTPATTIGRAEFRKPICKEDLVVGAYTVFVTKTLSSDMKFWDLCKILFDQMKEEITKKEQMNDFFAVCRDKDLGKLPPASFNGCTLGVSDIQHHYEHFDMESLYFLPCATRIPNMGGMNMHAFTIPDIGCYLHCTYLSPAFYKEEMEKYGDSLKLIFEKAISENLTLEDLLNTLL